MGSIPAILLYKTRGQGVFGDVRDLRWSIFLDNTIERGLKGTAVEILTKVVLMWERGSMWLDIFFLQSRACCLLGAARRYSSSTLLRDGHDITASASRQIQVADKEIHKFL